MKASPGEGSSGGGGGGKSKRQWRAVGGAGGKGGGVLMEIREECTLIAAAIFTVAALALTQRMWFPTAFVQSLLPAPKSCNLHLVLNSKGAWEGPWLDSSWQAVMTHHPAAHATSARDLVEQGKQVALAVGGDDGRVSNEQVRLGLPPSWLSPSLLPEVAAITAAYARLAERYLATWLPIPGVRSGLGKTGLVKKMALDSIARNPKLTPCTVHVRMLKGKLFFRYGSILESPRKLRRANLMLRMMQEAAVKHGLEGLKAELFLNVCDEPQSYDNSLSSGKSGFAVFSTQWAPGSTDILCPDPLDLVVARERAGTEAAGAAGDVAAAAATPWKAKEAKAIWRGAAFYVQPRVTNWVASVPIRLHRMSDARPDLLDARVDSYGTPVLAQTKRLMENSGLKLAAPMDVAEQWRRFKYAMVMDEQVGTRHMCSALASPQAVIRHASGFMQFFEPLLIPGVHYMPVRHSLADLFQILEWMQQNDAAVRRMVANANRIAPYLCSWDGQVHFWAVLLAKYSTRAMEDPEATTAPTVCEKGAAVVDASWANAKTPPTCKHPDNGPCSDFCTDGRKEHQWTWLSASVVAKAE